MDSVDQIEQMEDKTPPERRRGLSIAIVVVAMLLLVVCMALALIGWQLVSAAAPTEMPVSTATSTLTPEPLPAPTATPPPTEPPGYVQAVNAGACGAVTWAGMLWEADREYSSGSWGHVGSDYHPVSDGVAPPVLDEAGVAYGADGQYLHRCQVYGQAFGYRFDLSDGEYLVRLRFAEPIHTAGERWFDVVIEGQTVLDDFDVAAQAGGTGIALERDVLVTVIDGQLQIDFVGSQPGSADPNAFVQAIGVVTQGFEPPPAPVILPPVLSPTVTSTSTPTVTPTPAPLVDCRSFRATSPLDGIAYGQQTFYWDPAPGATGYRLLIFTNSGAKAFEGKTTETNLTVSTITEALGDVNVMPFSWKVEALVDEVVICTTETVTLLRAAAPTSEPPPASGIHGNLSARWYCYPSVAGKVEVEWSGAVPGENVSIVFTDSVGNSYSYVGKGPSGSVGFMIGTTNTVRDGMVSTVLSGSVTLPGGFGCP